MKWRPLVSRSGASSAWKSALGEPTAQAQEFHRHREVVRRVETFDDRCPDLPKPKEEDPGGGNEVGGWVGGPYQNKIPTGRPTGRAEERTGETKQPLGRFPPLVT